jgi:ammonium transporter Rh
MKGGA